MSEVHVFNIISNNILQKTNHSRVRSLCERLRESDVIMTIGSGRSLRAINIPMMQLDYNKKDRKLIKAITDVSVAGPRKTMRDLCEFGDKITVLFCSGSGSTKTVKEYAQGMVLQAQTINNKDIEFWAVTSYPESDLVSALQKASKYNVLLIQGREGWEKPENHRFGDARTGGIMGDKFELGVQALFTGIVENILTDKDFSDALKDGLESMFKEIDHIRATADYIEAVEHLSSRCYVAFAGEGPSRQVAEMAMIRFRHIKEAIGSERVYYVSEYPSRVRRGDVFFFISQSGETASTVNWLQKLIQKPIRAYSITSSRASRLAELNREGYNFILPRGIWFYVAASYLMSAITYDLVSRLVEDGINLPEDVLRGYHGLE